VPRYAATLRLSPHFEWGEFWQGSIEPPPWLYPAYVQLARLYLEPLRAAFGVCTVHSGYRTPEHNAAVAGAPRSLHLGRQTRPPAAAADVSFRSSTPREWFDAAARLSPGGLGRYPTHIHIDNRAGAPARW
jgi:uncharacterized protein YcbK (DUF882 family)